MFFFSQYLSVWFLLNTLMRVLLNFACNAKYMYNKKRYRPLSYLFVIFRSLSIILFCNLYETIRLFPTLRTYKYIYKYILWVFESRPFARRIQITKRSFLIVVRDLMCFFSIASNFCIVIIVPIETYDSRIILNCRNFEVSKYLRHHEKNILSILRWNFDVNHTL